MHAHSPPSCMHTTTHAYMIYDARTHTFLTHAHARQTPGFNSDHYSNHMSRVWHPHMARARIGVLIDDSHRGGTGSNCARSLDRMNGCGCTFPETAEASVSMLIGGVWPSQAAVCNGGTSICFISSRCLDRTNGPESPRITSITPDAYDTRTLVTDRRVYENLNFGAFNIAIDRHLS